MTDTPVKPYKGRGMEGFVASWYARQTAHDSAEFERTARRIADHLNPGSRVLEIAPGPGYLAIALAKLTGGRITGLDISRTFVRIAAENARQAGVAVDFEHGDAADLPFPDGQFDFIVCRAAFKNFTRPLVALNEMHRVLKEGGTALDHRSAQGLFAAGGERLLQGSRLRQRRDHQADLPHDVEKPRL